MHSEEPRWVLVWSCKSSAAAGAPKDTFAANGVLGQRVIVTPSTDLVIVHLGLNFDIGFDAAYGEELYTDIASNFPKSNVPLTTPDMLAMTV